VSRLIDGNYPDYRKVIPSKFLSRVLIERNDLEKDMIQKTKNLSEAIKQTSLKGMKSKFKDTNYIG